MNAKMPDEDDAPLHALLQEWKVSLPLPPRFQEAVWRQIEHPDTTEVPNVPVAVWVAQWIRFRLPRPALAAAYVAVLLAIGAGAGWSQARHEAARVTSDLGLRYAQLIDPYRASH